jgi:Ulp1 family protease
VNFRYKNNYVFSTFFFNYLLDKKNETYQYEKIIKWLQKRNINLNSNNKILIPLLIHGKENFSSKYL